MFKALSPLLAKATLNIRVSQGADGKLLVIVMPKAKEGQPSSALLERPMRFVGTPEELEQGLADQVSQLIQTQVALDASVQAQTEAIKKEAEALVAQAKEKSKSSKAPAKVVAPKAPAKAVGEIDPLAAELEQARDGTDENDGLEAEDNPFLQG